MPTRMVRSIRAIEASATCGVTSLRRNQLRPLADRGDYSERHPRGQRDSRTGAGDVTVSFWVDSMVVGGDSVADRFAEISPIGDRVASYSLKW